MSYQSDYSGAQVDEAVGKALNPDAAPTQDSTNLVTSGGVASAVSAVMGGFVPLLYTGTMPANGGEVNQAMFTGYNEYYLVHFQYSNSNGSTYGLPASEFSASPFIQYGKNNKTDPCKIRFTIPSKPAWNGRPYYVLLMAR